MNGVTDSKTTVLVTGAGSGIGGAIARRFAAAGYPVAVLDANAEAAEATTADIAASGAIALAVRCSVCDEDDVLAAFELIEQRLGPIGTLINNAGISSNGATDRLELARWQLALDVNLTGPFLCAREAGRRMMAAGKGVIFNMSSIFGTCAAPDRAAYCVTKAGVDMLTRCLAVEWAKQGIWVNAIAPGYTATPLVERLVSDGTIDEAALKGRTPLGRFAAAEEIADLALFLASDQAAYITGQTVGIDGGWTAYGYV